MKTGMRTALVAPVDAGRDHIRGGGPAAVTLVVYGDYECPFTRAAYRSVEAIEHRAPDGLRFVFRHFPLRDKHPHAQQAAEAAEEAAAQDAFWAMHERLFANQHQLERDALGGYARELGLDLQRFDEALLDGRHRERIAEDVDSGRRARVDGTPALFIDGWRYDGSYMPDELELALRRAAAS